MIAGEQEMVAIVDTATQLRIEIGTATAAGMRGGFIKAHVSTLGGQPDCCGKAREAGADDMHDAWRGPHTNPCRNMSQTLNGLDRLMRAAGSRQSERTNSESVAR